MTTVTLGPAPVDLKGIRAGDLNLITATVTMGGQPFDLTDLTLTAQARKLAIDPAPAVTAVVDVVDAEAGEITIRWPGSEVTTALAGADKWTGVWDLQADNGSDDPLTLAAGTFSAVMDVTR